MVKLSSSGKEEVTSNDRIVYKDIIHWFQEKIRRDEPITMPIFVEAFGYSFEQDAHMDYMDILSSTKIPRGTRAAIKKQYERWQRNEGRNFWASKTLSMEIAVTTKRVAAEIVSGSGHVVRKLIKVHHNDATPSARPASIDGSVPKKVSFFLETELSSNSEEGDSNFDGSSTSSRLSSLNSIDFSSMNWLVGPGTTSSRLSTFDRLFVGSVDVSEILLAARSSIVKRQSQITNIPELLTLNFIFTNDFVSKHLVSEVYTTVMAVNVPHPPEEEIHAFLESILYASSHSFVETKTHIREISKSGTLTDDLLLAFTTKAGLWQDPSAVVFDFPQLQQNEDTYTEIVIRCLIAGVFGELEVVEHWSRDPLPLPCGFEEPCFPDYFAEKAGLPFIVLEAKKPDIGQNALECDKKKVPATMKIMLDRLLEEGVQNPTVLGFLVQDAHCHVFFMELEHEALYFCRHVASFGLPRNRLQLGLLLPALGALHLVRKTAMRTLAAIEARTKVKKLTKRLQRPSYYIKGIRNPKHI